MKKIYYIDYPQEHVEGHAYTYRCAFCKLLTTTINGKLEGHLPTCEYRLEMENSGYEANTSKKKMELESADEVD
jgi:hypothetical protein